jgi:hypothetical protein
MRRCLVGHHVRADAAADQLGEDVGGIAEQADGQRRLFAAAVLDHGERLVEIAGLRIEIARAQPHLDAARLALHGEAGGARHGRGERLRAAHAAEAGGEDPSAGEVTAIVAPADLDEGLVSALNDALRPDIDPGAGRHLAVHHQALAVEFVEVVPGRPMRHEIGIGDQHARCVGMGAEDADRLAGLDEQGLVLLEPAERADDAVEALPVARGAADPAIDDELARSLGHVGIEIVHQHPQRRLGEPALRADAGAARSTNGAAVVDAGHGDPRGHSVSAKAMQASRMRCSELRTGAAKAGS